MKKLHTAISIIFDLFLGFKPVMTGILLILFVFGFIFGENLKVKMD